VTDAVEIFARQARESQQVLDVIGRAQEQMTTLVLELNRELAKLQRDPGDVGERIKRAILLRGTVENLVNEAIRRKEEG
jgi:hypothetical protein